MKSMGAKCGLYGPEFLIHNFAVLCAARRCHGGESLRRLGHSPDGPWQAFQCDSLLSVK